MQLGFINARACAFLVERTYFREKQNTLLADIAALCPRTDRHECRTGYMGEGGYGAWLKQTTGL